MSTFVNTVEKLGDAALTDSIINRTVTEYKDNIATRVGKSAFRRCLLLANVDMPNITYIDENAFNECSALNTLILRRTDSVVTLANANALANTPIAGGTGYIYVPSALVDAYKADTVWSVYASQIRAIEDWPYVCDLYSWDVVFQRIEDGSYDDVYEIGDTIPLDLGDEGVVNMEIVAFDADDLADGSGKAPITWIGKEALKTSHRMNPALVTEFSYPESPSWKHAALNQFVSVAQYGETAYLAECKFTVTAKQNASFIVQGGVNTNGCGKLSYWVNDELIVENHNSTSKVTHLVECVTGDTFTVRATYLPTNSSHSDAATMEVYIDKNNDGKHDTNDSGITLSDYFEITVDEIKNVPIRIHDGYQEGTGTIGGWEKSEMRTYLKDTIKPLIPETVRSRIKEVTKYSIKYFDANTKDVNGVTIDDVWIPSLREINSSGETVGVKYSYRFYDAESRKRVINSWWLRSASNISIYYQMGSDGLSKGSTPSNNNGGVILGFCT